MSNSTWYVWSVLETPTSNYTQLQFLCSKPDSLILKYIRPNLAFTFFSTVPPTAVLYNQQKANNLDIHSSCLKWLMLKNKILKKDVLSTIVLSQWQHPLFQKCRSSKPTRSQLCSIDLLSFQEQGILEVGEVRSYNFCS